MSAEKFANLLTEGIYKIRFEEAKTIRVIQDELGYSLGKEGGASIEHWRKGHIPPKLADIETLARQIVKRGRLEKTWLEAFLHNANHPAQEKICDALFPPLASAKIEVDTAPVSDPHLAALPLDTIPDPAPLPAGSLMPLSKNPLFVGREADLRALALALKSNGAMTISQVETAAATGLGGIGKTQLASEFVHRYGQFFAGGVFWLSFDNAEGIPAEIAACGAAGALELRPDFGQRPLSEQVNLVQAVWQRPVPRLLVFDNCEDPALLAQWRPVSGGCRILVTSRRGDWEVALGVQTLALGVLTRSESLALLQKHCPEVEETILDAIAEALGDLPLALHLAGRYLRYYKRSITPADYLAHLQDPLLLHHPSMQGQGISPTGHIQHVGRTFALSYDRLDPTDEIDALARKLLVHTAHFAPGEPIWYALLVQTLGLDADDPDAPMRSAQAFQRLIDVGLIETEANNILRMHRLVAKFVRDVARDEVAATQQAVEAVVFAETADRNKAVHPLPLLSWQLHLRSVVDVAKAREDAASARLCHELGQHLWQIGDFQGALLYHEKALAIRETIFGEEHPETAESLVSLGRVLRALGRLAEMKPYFERSLEIRQKLFGKYHRHTAESLENLGRCLQELGDPASGLPYIETALEIIQAILGEENELVAEYHNNIALCLSAMGNRAAALKHYEQALITNEAVLGPEHPHTALNCHNLGSVLCRLDKFVEAQSYLKRALTIRRQAYGDDHHDTAISVSTMALLLYNLGQITEARPLAEQALAKFIQLLGQSHIRTAYGHSVLGKILQRQGEIEPAKIHLQKALAIRQAALGEDHYLTAEIRTDLDEFDQT